MDVSQNLQALRHTVHRQSEAISAAGTGLCAIAEVLGADGSEHHLSDDVKEGLAHAVFAIGELLKENGNFLWTMSEEGVAQ